MKLEALEALLVGYLHEDWADDYPDVWHAIDDYSTSNPTRARRLRADVDHVLERCHTENDTEDCLDRLGLTYHPPGAGWNSYRQWLVAVADRVDELLHKSPAA